MINVTNAYIEACKKPIRNSYIVVKYGLYNKKAKSQIEETQGSIKAFTSIAQTYDEIKNQSYFYISNEPNRVTLNGTFAFVQNKEEVTSTQNLGVWTSAMSNANKKFETNPTLVYVFSEPIPFTELTLYFQEIVTNLKIKYYLNDILQYTNTITNNAQKKVETKSTTNIPYFDKLELEFVETQEAYRYVKLLEIDFGVTQSFEKEEIKQMDIIDELSIDSSELASNSCNLTIADYQHEYDLLNPFNKLSNLQEKQELTVYHYLKVGAMYKEIPLGTFLLKNITHTSNTMELECYDDTYFMNKTYYGSKVYKNAPVKEVFEDLFTYFNYDTKKYLIDDELQNVKLTGYIGQVEFREALRLIAESCCAVVNKTRYGITYIFKTYDSSIHTFKLNEYASLSPQKNLYNNVIDVSEYNYTTISEEKELFNDTMSKGTYLINFSSYPIVYEQYKNNPNLLLGTGTSTGVTITDLYATCCKINIQNDNSIVKIVGKVYNEGRTTKRYQKDKNLDVDEYAISSVDNTLITKDNSSVVANWKLSRSELNYSLTIPMTPYIEVGDTCKIQTKYKDLNGKYVLKEYVPTRLEFTNSILQTMEGE